MAHQYFNESLTPEQLKAGNTASFSGDEARHAVKVSRLRVGETIMISNGTGYWASGLVSEASTDIVSIKLEKSGFKPIQNPKFTLIQALAKSGRDEQSVEQATEYGIDEVIAWQADRSIVRWDSTKSEKGLKKWARIAREASKQSLRARIPICDKLASISDLASLCAKPNNYLFVLEPSSNSSLSSEIESLKAQINTADSVEIFFLVGPEGGISNPEIKTLVEHGATLVQLGENVLRTSSAGPAALAIANTILGRW